MGDEFAETIMNDSELKLKAMRALVGIVEEDNDVMVKFVTKFSKLLTAEEKKKLNAVMGVKDSSKVKAKVVDKFCSECGTEIKGGNYCTGCGKPLR